MLTHRQNAETRPKRVVVLGAGGFVGAAAARAMDAGGIPVLRLARTDIDLLTSDASDRLTDALRPEDALVVVSARAPCKTAGQLVENTAMMRPVCDALARKPVAHVVYVSSDAVYRDSDGPLTEASCAEPGSLHGAMHLAREVLFRSEVKAPIAMLRPSLLYGAGDPHNGYGPNQFRRLAAQSKPIVLFGEGEERRDHVWVEDVAALIRLMVLFRSEGVLNAATGRVWSFREIADIVVAQFAVRVPIETRPRSGPMPHNGYRPFEIAACQAAFPSFQYTSLPDGLFKVRAETKDDIDA